MNKLLKKLFDIREGEGLRASLMFVYIFLLIASLLIVKPVRNSLFLSHFGASQLPYVYMLVAVSAAIIISLYTKFSKRIRLNVLLFYTLIFSIVLFLLFWFFLTINYQAGWFYYAFYIWVALFGVLITSQFWLLANYVFNAREAKRLFGFVGAGAIAGGIFGGYLTSILATIVNTTNLIFFCVIFLIISIFIMRYVWKRSARQNYSDRLLQEKRVRRSVSEDNPIKLFSRSKHLSYLAALVGIGVIVANLVDFQFLAIAEEKIIDADERTAFFGFWLSNLSVASLFVQLLLTRQVLKIFGVTFSLVFLPFGILIGALTILINPALWSAILIKVSDGGFKQSINKAGIELLALPIPATIKNQGKAFIDIFVDSLATGIGGLLLIVFIQQFGISIPGVSLLILFLLIFWLYFIHKVRLEYINSFRLALEKRTIDLHDQNINLQDASVFESFIKVFNEGNDRNILYSLQLIENVENEEFIPHLKTLLKHHSNEVKVSAIQNLQQYSINLSEDVCELLQDESFDVQAEAARYLFRFSNGNGSFLKESLIHSDFRVRTAALLVVASEYRDNKMFRETFNLQQHFDDYIEQCYEKNTNPAQKDFIKVNLANVIGISNDPQLFPFLEKLLLDQSPKVVEAAMENAGKTRDPMFIPILIRHLNTNLVRKFARQALTEYSDDAINIFEEYLQNPNLESRIRLGIPKILAMIGTQNSVNLLLNSLDQYNEMLRFEIIKALSNLKEEFPFLKFDSKNIDKRITLETEKYFKTLAILYSKGSLIADEVTKTQKQSSTQKANQLLLRALEEKLDNNLERIFKLLGIRYSTKDMANVYLAIVSKKPNLRANAIEFLDNILDPRLKRFIIPIVEQSSTVRKNFADKYSEIRINSRTEVIKVILEDDDNWLKACTIHFMAINEIKEPVWMLKKFSTESDSLVRETAEFALNRLKLSDKRS